MMNPVLQKEFKLRFRSKKPIISLLAYLSAIGILILGFIYLQTLSNPSGYFHPSESKTMFMLLSFLQAILVLFITPGLTAGVISSERERQTLNILLTTNQSSTSIIIGKLVSSLSYLLLLILASLPLYSFVFLFGGVSPVTIIQVFGFYIFTMFAFGSIGVFLSTVIRRTIISMVTTYATTLFLAGGTAFLLVILIGLSESQQILTLNVLAYFIASLNPIIVFASIFDYSFLEGLYEMTNISIPIWASYIFLYTLAAITALFFSVKKLRPSMKSLSSQKKPDA
ncbi:ABC transporter permease [Bacillus chungangensis]|nr:ABC transporter permease subunit [Bacillus chungangensis]